MFKLSKWTKWAIFVGLFVSVVLLASAYPQVGEAQRKKPTATKPVEQRKKLTATKPVKQRKKPQVTTPVDLGTAGNFAVLAASAVNDTNPSAITGNVGLSPAAWPPTPELTCGEVTGTIYSVDASGPMPCRVTNAGLLTTAKNDLTTAYNDAAGRPASTIAPELGGQTLLDGVYNSAAGTFEIVAGGTLTLDGGGNANSVFIFKMASTLTTFSNSRVVLSNGADACNVFWQVGSSAVLGTGTNFVGTVMADQSITDNGGSTVNGRFLARIAAVTLNNTTISLPVCVAATPTPTSTPTSTITGTPTNTPTNTPTSTPTETPTNTPTNTPTSTITGTPTNTQGPSPTPTNTPTSTLTNTPGPSPTPTNTPTSTLTNTPGPSPTPTNTRRRTRTPTNTPTVTDTPRQTRTPRPGTPTPIAPVPPAEVPEAETLWLLGTGGSGLASYLLYKWRQRRRKQ